MLFENKIRSVNNLGIKIRTIDIKLKFKNCYIKKGGIFNIPPLHL